MSTRILYICGRRNNGQPPRLFTFMKKSMWRFSPKKQKKLVFQTCITVHECTNIPQSLGRVYCKWKTQSQSKLAGVTPAVKVVGTTAKWDFTFTMHACELGASSKTNVVSDYFVRLSIRQESTTNVKGFVRLGVVNINLAEYAGKHAITRRYLLSESSFNSTVHVSVKTTQLDGDPLFKCVEMKTSQHIVTEEPSTDRKQDDDHMQRNRSMRGLLESRESVHNVVGDVLRESEENRSKLLPSK